MCTKLSAAIAIGALALMFALPGAAKAEECRLFGTAPFCNGTCPSGWRLVNFVRSNCWAGGPGFSGTKAHCCKIEPRVRCTPARFGQPGCPYPSFSRKPLPKPAPSAEPCPKGMFKGGDGQCYPRLG
jgi:hypothetical protein